ncbi:hypothetical protein LINPERHAP2_LOCUS25402 [Linum perenne]
MSQSQPRGRQNMATVASQSPNILTERNQRENTNLNWRLMPQQYKDSMWDLIEGKFEVDLLAKCNIMNSLSKKWKDFKANVKVAWVKENIRDERVSNQDWECLLKFWDSDKAGRLAAPGNEEPSRADVYIATHVRRDGKPLNDEVAGYIEKMKELKTRLPTTGDDHGPNDVYAQVLGADKPGSTRTYGLGSMKGVKNSRMLMVKQALEAKKSAEDEVKSVREEISELRKEQTKIFALFQKTNPDINVDDIVSSPLRDDIDLNHNFNEGGSNQVN